MGRKRVHGKDEQVRVELVRDVAIVVGPTMLQHLGEHRADEREYQGVKRDCSENSVSVRQNQGAVHEVRRIPACQRIHIK